MIVHSQQAIEEGVRYADLTAHFLNELTDISKQTYEITEDLAKLVGNEKLSLENASLDISQISRHARQNLESSSAVASLSGDLHNRLKVLKKCPGVSVFVPVPKGGMDNDSKKTLYHGLPCSYDYAFHKRL